jgi:uncharacterized cupredoxin-like copper-binding protein
MYAKTAGLAAAVALAIAGCGGSSSNNNASATKTPAATNMPSSATSSSTTGGEVVKIGADPNGALKFTKKTLTAKAGTVTFSFSNPSQTPHAFEVEGHGVEKSTKTITAGTAGVTVKLKPGTYEFYCPVDGHKAAGMKGTLTVQ